MTIFVNTKAKLISFQSYSLPCRVGSQGFILQKDGAEGDAKTPLGEYFLRFGLYRADRLPKPKSALTFRPLRETDGWSDDISDSAYNRFIRLPSNMSHEALWRKDGAYDIVIVMSHNDSPPKSGLGSAVFLHIAQPDDRQTLGCVALAPEAMVKLLPVLYTGQKITLQA